jgi:hypothetical protein
MQFRDDTPDASMAVIGGNLNKSACRRGIA